jgi:hypothetical protein
VSKPGGASVADCCAITGCPIESMPSKTRIEMGPGLIALAFLERGFIA